MGAWRRRWLTGHCLHFVEVRSIELACVRLSVGAVTMIVLTGIYRVVISAHLLKILQLDTSSFLLRGWVRVHQDLVGESFAQSNLVLRVVLPSTTLVTTATLTARVHSAIFLLTTASPLVLLICADTFLASIEALFLALRTGSDPTCRLFASSHGVCLRRRIGGR